jgi:large subunit ribosomal protein L21
MFAVIETGGKQYIVEQGTTLDIEKLTANPGESVTFEQVLFIGTDTDIEVGQPYLAGKKVVAKVVDQIKAPKEIIFKFKRKTGYKKTQGHRQKMTTVKIESIG